MNRHEKIPEWIDRFNNKTLHGRELKEFLELMKQDPELRREVRLDAEINELLADGEVLELRKKIARSKPPEENNYTWLPIFFLAASVTLFIVLSILTYIFMTREDNPVTIADILNIHSDSVVLSKNYMTDEKLMAADQALFDSLADMKKHEEARKKNDRLLSDNYKPLPAYESLVGQISRAVAFKLINPSAVSIFKKGALITFSWEADPSYSVTIVIADNKGGSMFLSKPINGKTFLFNTSELTQGLFYVKFIYKDEIAYFSKFTLY